MNANEDMLNEIYIKLDNYSLVYDKDLINGIANDKINKESNNYNLLKSMEDCKCLIEMSYNYLSKDSLLELIKKLLNENTFLKYYIQQNKN
ncbi:similar to ferrochelatase [Betaentomopoxvirus amoorei]|uniref:AMVITR03 n=1 Tax=Amsacta moorei entomopoxvirus TaxID=28321 RepID=Q9DGT0_AMEPV|nr:hypothetical protein AMVITR03a [Amsacta moorei entomopoxvirus]NP_065059.1 similar to ferrochelatase [Amsacta moorei entomopoxvirus]AAG02975.1 AMVITR03 [Amsacta moorei entomopoxvirus]AAG02997.1 AMVITR03 [Amsacta moorei entomopoxvirus]